jgi:hypothetical protein
MYSSRVLVIACTEGTAMSALNAPQILDREFLGIRSRLVDIAAALDRIDRGAGSAANDSRLELVRRSLEILLTARRDRAEQLQMLFSLPYDEDWRRQFGI